jgi:hypothetical protein
VRRQPAPLRARRPRLLPSWRGSSLDLRSCWSSNPGVSRRRVRRPQPGERGSVVDDGRAPIPERLTVGRERAVPVSVDEALVRLLFSPDSREQERQPTCSTTHERGGLGDDREPSVRLSDTTKATIGAARRCHGPATRR